LLVMRPGQEREETAAEGDPNLKMNEVFVDAVRSGDASAILSDYEDGLRTFELTYACQLAAEQGREVRLSEL
jgi:myo-inositol 2-dehydrogenase/D-chiro-inositol 1-dehydrogenase